MFGDQDIGSHMEGVIRLLNGREVVQSTEHP